MNDEYYRHWSKRLIYTGGVKWMAEQGQAFWLVDAVASHQGYERVRAEGFQVWTLKVFSDRTATLTMTDGNTEKPIVEQRIEFTDYPEAEAELYCVLSPGQSPVLMLPAEY